MVNKAIIVGRLGKDPEVRYTSSGQAVANFSVATDESYKKDGETQKKTEWHNIVMWGKLAEVAEQYLKKGQLVYLEGKLQTRQWENKQDGTTRYTTEIVVFTLKMLGGKPEGQTKAAPNGYKTAAAGKPAAAPKGGYKKPAPAKTAEPESDPFEASDEDTAF